MPLSMLFGRVLLPAIGLALAAVLLWQVARTGSPELSPTSMRGVFRWIDEEPPQMKAKSLSADNPGPPPAPTIMAEGRVVAYPGAEIIVGAEAPGTILRVLVQEKASVRRGDLLVEFKSDELKASLDEAVARVAETGAEVDHQQKELTRVDRLIARKAATDEERERVVSRLVVARSRQAAAMAIVKRLEASIAKTRILAPIDGIVIARLAHPGETLNVGTPLVKIVDLSKLRIEAEVDEFDISHCAPGSPATITTEGYGGKPWRGMVEEIADIVTGRRIRPEDPGRPTDSRVLPVRIAFLKPTPLKLGQRVEVQIAGRSSHPSKPLGSSASPPRGRTDQRSRVDNHSSSRETYIQSRAR